MYLKIIKQLEVSKILLDAANPHGYASVAFFDWVVHQRAGSAT